MEAPKEIYLFQSKNDGSVGVAHHEHPVETEKTISIKYVRADLAELTWEVIRAICDCFMDAGLHGELPARSKEFYEEVLRRFLESKK